MTTHALLLLPGDGIGIETIAEVERLIAFFNARSNKGKFVVERDLVGGSAYDAHGVSITDAAMGRSGTKSLMNTAPKLAYCACAKTSISSPTCARPSAIRRSLMRRA
jgi:isocitrate/isopropylmalate dehydrogenase